MKNLPFGLSCCNWWHSVLAVVVIGGFAIYSAQAFSGSGEVPSHDKRSRLLQQTAKKLIPLHREMGEVQSGDWLESHKEKGQKFSQYIRSKPVTLTDQRRVLYVLPLGEFDEHQKRIVELSAGFLGLYFGCEVKTMETLTLDQAIPESARRVHPSWGMQQIRSTFVLDRVLPPLLPDNAVALIAFTSSDLYPEEDWNFVFGQASLHNRVGVWSIFRNGDPATEFTSCLKRTLRTATHETGHMFSIAHCTAYECNMCGSNNQGESDRRPLYLCPECIAKVWWATDCDPVARYQGLAEFCESNELLDEADFYRKSLELIQSEKQQDRD